MSLASSSAVRLRLVLSAAAKARSATCNDVGQCLASLALDLLPKPSRVRSAWALASLTNSAGRFANAPGPFKILCLDRACSCCFTQPAAYGLFFTFGAFDGVVDLGCRFFCMAISGYKPPSAAAG